MSDAAPPPAAATQQGAEVQRVTELRVSGHLMLLDPGLFCIFQPPGAPAAGPSGLPGVRISQAPMAPAGAVAISTFHPDGWLPGGEGAALVRVARGPAPILVTIYQAPDAPTEAAPRLQVLRLSADAPVRPAAAPVQPPAPAPARAEIVAHVQRAGDQRAPLGEWIGTAGSKQWIEGF
ncbi:MAG: hypothetical protein KGI51_00975, partial [Rhodospirillales bacterium]|nr:hypothetical protein [Rhodospirillales bacterium]